MSKVICFCIHALLLRQIIAVRVIVKTGADSNRTTSPFVPIDRMLPGFHCPSDFYFEGQGSLPDLVKEAHTWCNSDLVPADKRVPEFLRGLYWMKDLQLDDVAFCPSLGEWDPETRSAKLAVWTHFVFRKAEGDDVAELAKGAAKVSFNWNKPLVYTITFTDDTFTTANIVTNAPVMNFWIKFPLQELQQTEDGQVVSKKQGDVFDRPSFFGPNFFGTGWFKTDALSKDSRYYAVRVMDDDGTVHQDVYNLMKDAEKRDTGAVFVRYDTQCDEGGKRVNSDGSSVS